MPTFKTIELPIQGMDCAECSLHVQHALEKVPGVASAEVFLTTEKAVLRLDPEQVNLPILRRAVAGAGNYSVPETAPASAPAMRGLDRRLGALLAAVFALVLVVVIAGEWLAWFRLLEERVPFLAGAAVVLVGGWPIFNTVVRAALKRQVIAHTLMTLGALAALAVGQWVTAAIVVVFMRVGAAVEAFTTESARRAVKELTAISPQTARVERAGGEQEVPVAQVAAGEIVVVRPGEKIPVDGEVVDGYATVNQAALTGESLPVEAAPGTHVLAATLAQLGSLRVKTERVGADTTFGRVVKMVEEAEAHRADVQRFADRFSGYYLPLVAGLAALTFLISRNPLATAAVLLVACSCSIALATPVAMLASIGAGAKRGLLIKGGKYLETLARADVLLVDKTGTLTLGRPELTDIVPLNGQSAHDLLALAAAAERYSEHPLAEAVRAAARARGLKVPEPAEFRAIPGQGVQARVAGQSVVVGNRRLIAAGAADADTARLEAQGKTVLFVESGGRLAGLLAAADTLRPEVPAALAEARRLGIQQIELLTGDNARTAAGLAETLGVRYRANLLPEDKINIVREYQAQGRTVVMVGDGVNDAPALAQADVGIALAVSGGAGTDIAFEAAHVVLLRDDWALVPEVLQIAQRTLRVVKLNLGFTAVYNLLGLGLAALGLLPPVLAAAAQSLPDLGILANSARLLRQRSSD